MMESIDEKPDVANTPDIEQPADQQDKIATHQDDDDVSSVRTMNSAKTAASADTIAAKETPSSPPSLMKIFRMAGPELPMLVVAILLMIAGESTQLILPVIIAKAYDVLVNIELTDSERMADISRSMAIALIIYAAGMVASFLRAAILGIIGERMVARLRYQLYGSILKQEIGFFDEHKSGELVSRLGSDTTLLQQVISTSIPEALVGIMKTLVSIGLMFWISPKLAALSLASVFLLCLLVAPLGQMLSKLSKAYQDVLGEAQTYSTEAFGSMRTVQAFAAEVKELKRFGTRIGNPEETSWWWPKSEPSTYRVGFFKSLTTSAFFVIIFGLGFGFLYTSLWYGFYLVIQMELTLGDLTAFQAYIFQIGFGLGGSAAQIAKIFEGLGASGRVFYLLERVPTIPVPPAADTGAENGEKVEETTPLKPESLSGNVDFRNVTFSYPSRPDIAVLKDYTLKIPQNTTTALVGSSGSGKSTVVALLQRFYDISGGELLFDGIPIQSLDLRWLRQRIGYVQQEPQLFGLSVRENLLYGVEDEIPQAEIEKACKEANAHDFISQWPNGYETLVGERGVKLSGGQKQRLAIARALLTNCRILLLDEATSALDAESEHLVQEAIDKAMVGRTVVVVAHRLSTIRNADQIVVMSNHTIVGVGSHDSLLSSCKKYQDLIKRQNITTSAPSSSK